ncbi:MULTISPECIES: sensor domain-containing diguanylate cyclase [Acidobacterium]|nr:MULTISPECIES: sensor domain-containing diguanylate cyclase [Acidobacterium]HCT60782.1 GGDEF domain-containing protein [Acidobacterium sp.]
MAEITDPQVLRQIIRTQNEISRLGPDLGAVIQCAAESVQQLTHAGAAIVEMAEGDQMVYRAATGFATACLGLRLKREGSLTGLCIQNGQMLICSDSETDPRVDRDACRRVGLRSMVVAPLFFHQSPVGVLKIASPLPDAFREQDMAVLDSMCELIASAMFHAARMEEGELYYKATHDSLTGLPNRALFYDRLRQRLALARRNGVSFAVLSLDMDGLKSINDTYGHQAGDAALRETAARIKAITRVSDTFARLGGDEFALLLTEVHNREGALEAASRLEQALFEPLQFEGWRLPLSLSIGHALFPLDGEEIDPLLDAADQAMYQTKRHRTNKAEDFAI